MGTMKSRETSCDLRKQIDARSQTESLIPLDVPNSDYRIGVATAGMFVYGKMTCLEEGVCAFDYALDAKGDVVKRIVERSEAIFVKCGVKGCERIIVFGQPPGGTSRHSR